MRELETTVTQKGQVTIPAEIRSRFGIKPRDKVVFEVEGDAVRMRPLTSKILRGYGAVAPHQQPEDFASLRQSFEQGVAEEAAAEDAQ